MQEDGISNGKEPMDEDSKQVSEKTKHRAQVEALRHKAVPSIWTDGMLNALVEGVKGGQRYDSFFAARGLFSMAKAWERMIQSL